MRPQVIVVGAGASGLTAAIFAARQGACVTLLEHKPKPGKKLLSTGNGKCNITNLMMPKDAYRGGKPDFIKEVLAQFSVEQTLDFFRELGMVFTNRNGYVYPYSGQAVTVLESLLFELEHLGVKMITDCEVESIKKDLTIQTTKGQYRADSVILAAGSMAAPKTGSDGSGYQLAKSLGHRIIKPLPALVQLRCKESWYSQAAGVRSEACVSLYIDGKQAAKDKGELQFTDYGISGIPVFQVSRFAAKGLDAGAKVIAEIDLFPAMDRVQLERLLFERKQKFSYRPAKEFLHGVIHEKLGHVLLKEAGIVKMNKSKEIPAENIKRLVNVMKGLQTVVTETNSFLQCQVCSGGIDTREVNPHTMESKRIPGLYLAGEILDVDGICGGYNLQWAWASGRSAGIHAGRRKS